MDEVWRPVPNYEGSYEVSNLGRVRSVRDDIIEGTTYRVLKNSGRIPTASLSKSNEVTVYPVRLLVACAFLGCNIDASPKPKIEHVDGNFLNCAVDNLRIISVHSYEDEVWKDIPGFEGVYQISDHGRVVRKPRHDKYIRKDTGKECFREVSEKLITPSLTSGYYEVNLVSGNKSVYKRIHRLVADAFVSNPNRLPQVNHIDGDRLNNNASNLEWVTCKRNIEHAFDTGLRKNPPKGEYRGPVKFQCIETDETFETLLEGSKSLNITYNYLSECVRLGRSCHGLHFKILNKEKGVNQPHE